MTLDDAVSRQAFDDIKELMTDINGDTVYAVRMSDIRQLPSVNPQKPCKDAISREKVCDYITEFINHEYSTDAECEMIDLMIKGIQHMPSVNPQEKTGHWICTGYDGYANGYPVYDMWECSECGHEHSGESGTLTDFCPGCGARMFELQEGSDKE